MSSCAEATALWELLEGDPGKRNVQLMGQANASFTQSQDEVNQTSWARWNQPQKAAGGFAGKRCCMKKHGHHLPPGNTRRGDVCYQLCKIPAPARGVAEEEGQVRQQRCN